MPRTSPITPVFSRSVKYLNFFLKINKYLNLGGQIPPLEPYQFRDESQQEPIDRREGKKAKEVTLPVTVIVLGNIYPRFWFEGHVDCI